MATGCPHLLDDEELLQWDFRPTVKALVNAQQRLQQLRIRRNNSTRANSNTNSEITTLIELNHWSMGHRASHCNDDDDHSVFLTHPPVLLPPSICDASKYYSSSSSSSSEDAILSNTSDESIIIVDELIDESVLMCCCSDDDDNDTSHPCCNDTNEQRQRQRLLTTTTTTTTGRSDAAGSICSTDVKQQRVMSNDSKSWYTEWTFNIVYHPTYHVPTLYFTACHLDGTVLTFEEVMHTLQQYQHYQQYQSSIDDEANNIDDGGNELHNNNMDERGSNDHDEEDVKYYYHETTTTEVEIHYSDEFISHEEHPITGMPCYCIHPCRTTDRMQFISSSSSSIAGTTTTTSSVMEDDEEHHDPNVNATTTAASVPLLLSWMSMILPIVGCCLSSYTYRQLVVSVIDEKQKILQQQKQQKTKQDGMETSLRLQQKDTIETIDELKVTEEDGVIIDNIGDQGGAAIQSSSYSNTTALDVNDDSTTPITTTTITSDEYDKGEQQPQQRRHQTINPILHTSFIVAIVIFCCYIAQSNTRPLSSSSIPPMLLFTYANNETIATSPHQQQRVLDGNYYYYHDCKHCSQRKRWRRKLRAMPGDATNNLIKEGGSQQRSTNSNNEKDNNNKLTIVGGVQINMLRRAKDIVSNTDVPFLLQLPNTHHEILYDIMTQCYGLTPRQYLSLEELSKAKENNIVNSHYVNFHDIDHHEDHRRAGRSYFHFFATPYYTQGVELLTLMHKGRIIAMLRHPVLVAEEMYVEYLQSKQRRMTTATMKTSASSSLSFDYTVQDVLHHVNSTNYHDNQLTRMLVNIPPDVKVTEELFREARMILENKFLIGMSYDLIETIQKRLSLYFGWKEIETKAGCVVEHILTGQQTISSSTNKLLIVEGSPQWKFVAKHNRYDVKLYARAMAVFGDQKMRVPIHSSIRAEETAVVDAAFFSGHLLDITEPRADTDIPFFWHIPKASGTTVKETLSDCYGLVRTEMIRPPSSLEIIPDTKVLNVDLSTPEAIASARRENMVDRGLANVIVSQLGLEGSTLFTTLHQGRAFTILRHPVKLAVSLFYYRRIATWEPTYRPEYKDITLQEYVERDGYYDNWMVRMLTNAKIGGLNEGHLDLAKTILKRKFIIGISDQMTETFRRLEMFFGWKEGKAGCVDFHLNAAPSNKNKYPELDQDDLVWTIISTKNKYDMALYYYALELCESHLSYIYTCLLPLKIDFALLILMLHNT